MANAAAADSSSNNSYGYALRHRAEHVSDFVKRLDRVQTPLLPRDFPTIAKQQERTDGYVNLTHWIERAVQSNTCHLGFEKAFLYLSFLQVFVRTMLPDSKEMHHLVAEIEKYLVYLATPLEPPPANGKPKAVPGVSTVTAASISPAPPSESRELQALISPRTISNSKTKASSLYSPRAPSMANASSHSPSPTPHRLKHTKSPMPPKTWRPKRIIEISNHELAILDLARFFHFACEQLVVKFKRTQAKLEDPGASSKQEKLTECKEIKHKLACGTFFRQLFASVMPLRHASILSGGIMAPQWSSTHGPMSDLGSSIATNRASSPLSRAVGEVGSVVVSEYFALVVVSFHEITRRLASFANELAQFNGKLLEDTLQCFVKCLANVLTKQYVAKQQLDQLKQQKLQLVGAIAEVEAAIHRVKQDSALVFASLAKEQQEKKALEQEENWHNHCKSLLAKILSQLASEINQSKTILAEKSMQYRELPHGSALIHFHARFQLNFLVQLMTLSRSFLHLYHSKTLRSPTTAQRVATSSSAVGAGFGSSPTSRSGTAAAETSRTQHTTPASAGGVGSVVRASLRTPQSSLLTDSADGFLESLMARLINPMDEISESELQALRLINDIQRSIHALYGDTSAVPRMGRMAHEVSKQDVWTQFPQPIEQPVEDASTSIDDKRSKRNRFRSVAFGVQLVARTSMVMGAGQHQDLLVGALPGSGSPVHTGLGKNSWTSSITRAQFEQMMLLVQLPTDLKRLPSIVRSTLFKWFSHQKATGFSKYLPAFTREELLNKINWLYRELLAGPEASAAAHSTASPVGVHGVSHITSSGSTVESSHSTTNNPQNVLKRMVTHQGFLNQMALVFLAANDTNVEKTEIEMAHFLFSIEKHVRQINSTTCSSSSASSGGGAGSSTKSDGGICGGPGLGGLLHGRMYDAIWMFAFLIGLVEWREEKRAPPNAWQALFYIRMMLSRASLTKMSWGTLRSALGGYVPFALPTNDGNAVSSHETVWILHEDFYHHTHHSPRNHHQPPVPANPSAPPTAASTSSGLDSGTASPANASSSGSTPSTAAPVAAAGATVTGTHILWQSVKVFVMFLLSQANSETFLMQEIQNSVVDRCSLAHVFLQSLATPASLHSVMATVKLTSLGSSSTAVSMGTMDNNSNASESPSSPTNSTSISVGGLMDGSGIELVDSAILPLEVAVTISMSAWLDQQAKVKRRLRNAFESALLDDTASISLQEFVNVFMAVSSVPTSSQLTSLFTRALAHRNDMAREREMMNRLQPPVANDACDESEQHHLLEVSGVTSHNRSHTSHLMTMAHPCLTWEDLCDFMMEEFDLMNLKPKLVQFDFYSLLRFATASATASSHPASTSSSYLAGHSSSLSLANAMTSGNAANGAAAPVFSFATAPAGLTTYSFFINQEMDAYRIENWKNNFLHHRDKIKDAISIAATSENIVESFVICAVCTKRVHKIEQLVLKKSIHATTTTTTSSTSSAAGASSTLTTAASSMLSPPSSPSNALLMDMNQLDVLHNALVLFHREYAKVKAILDRAKQKQRNRQNLAATTSLTISTTNAVPSSSPTASPTATTAAVAAMMNTLIAGSPLPSPTARKDKDTR